MYYGHVYSNPLLVMIKECKVSKVQPTTEQAHRLENQQNAALKRLTIIGYLEGTSFLLLLGVAMPLKYIMGIPEAVKYVGMAHGALFIAYILTLMLVINKIKTPLWTMPAGVLGSLLPFGPFIFDYLLKKSVNKKR